MKKIRELNYQRISEEIVNFLRNEFKKRNKTRAIIGISGGIDSAVTAALCKKAKLDLYIVHMPYKRRSVKEASKVIKWLNIPEKKVIRIDITSLVDSQIEKLKEVIKLDKITIGNFLPRQRMIILYALASSLNGLVVGTQNLSEYCLGYFTRYGDQLADIYPIISLWKIQIYELAKHLKIPRLIIKRVPRGDLFPGVTDEKDLGFKYRNADLILYLLICREYPKERIISEYNFDSNYIEKILERVKITNYKRKPSTYFLGVKGRNKT